MNEKLTSLMQKAKEADLNEGRGRFNQFLPIIKILIEERGYNRIKAIQWLVDQGEIKQEDQLAAYQSITAYFCRMNKKGLK